MKVYLDHAATTPADPRVVEAMSPYWTDVAGNAASLHGFGRDAEDAAELARRELAEALGVRAEELTFTSGGTEANNLALRGVLDSLEGERRHLVTTAIEHPAVLRVAQDLERRGRADLTLVPVDTDGLVDPDAVASAMTDRTALVSVMAVNNETGAIQPVAEVGARCRERGIPLHCDAVQAFGKTALDVPALDADLVTVSAHKIAGPKGVGALWVRRGTRLRPLFAGGHQEHGLRPGTLAVPLVVGFGAAARITAREGDAHRAEARRLSERLLAGIERIENARLSGPREQRVPHLINVCIPGTSGEALLILLDQAGVAVSTGSACASGSALPSHVLTAMGLSRRDAQASLRLSLSHRNDEDEIDHVLDALGAAVERLRSMRFDRRR